MPHRRLRPRIRRVMKTSFDPVDVGEALKNIGDQPQLIMFMGMESEEEIKAAGVRGMITVQESQLEAGFVVNGNISILPGHFNPNKNILILPDIDAIEEVAQATAKYSTNFPTHFFFLAIFGELDAATQQAIPRPELALLILDHVEEVDEISEHKPPLGMFAVIKDGKLFKHSNEFTSRLLEVN